MNHRPSPRGVLATAGGAAALVALGLAAGAVLWRTSPTPQAPTGGTTSMTPMTTSAEMTTSPGAPGPDVVVTLTPELVSRAGIRTEVAVSGTATTERRLPGVVQPNAYAQTAVTSLVSGRVTEVRAVLGQRVVRGQVMAIVYSPEFADAQTNFVGMHAELTAHDANLSRTRRLATIGAASRQELESLEADHARLEAAVEAARSRLLLLGLPEARLDALRIDHKVTVNAEIAAPSTGVVTERHANIGLNIDPATPLFTVSNLSSVWVVADLYEHDMATVRVGSAATVTTTAYPGYAVEGRVSYIDSRIHEQTRTAQVRVEIPNRDGQLRMGMYVDVRVDATGRSAVLVPASALHSIGERRVVYVASAAEPGRYAERVVEVAEASGDRIGVMSGVSAGERVVSEGGAYLRAERERTAGAHAH
jgi:RND family efflux transporter MFP subunit